MLKQIRFLYYLIIISSSVNSSEDRLPSLSDKDMAATMGQSSHYALEIKQQFPQMHAQGDTWPDDKLQLIFLKGIFQHYFHQFSGFCYEDNYQQYKELKNNGNPIGKYGCKIIYTLLIINKIKVPNYRMMTEPTLEQFDQIMDLMIWVKTIGNALKNNEVFKTLGGDYQRGKIIIEKIELDLEKNKELIEDEKQSRFKKLLEIDRQNLDMLTLLFHWIKDTCHKTRSVLKEYYHNEQKIPPTNHPLINELRTFYPDYLFRPVYKKLLKGLPEPVQEQHQPRSAEELENLIFEEGIPEPLEKACLLAQRAFGPEENELDYNFYTQAYDELITHLREKLNIHDDEISILNTILDGVILPRG